MKLFSWKIFLEASTGKQDSVFFNNQERLLLESVEFVRPGPLPNAHNNKFRMLIDCDSCLDRLYGGFFPDFQSGGQWHCLHGFYQDLKKCCEANNMEVIFYLNGTSSDSTDSHEWLVTQSKNTWKVKKIVENFSPSQKAASTYFFPPSFLSDFIRIEAKSNRDNKSLYAFQSTNDHAKEILDFCDKFNCDALLTTNLDILTLFLNHQNLSSDSPKFKYTTLYEASSLKLYRNLTMTVKKYNLDMLLEVYDLTKEQFTWFNILLGTKFFPSTWLRKFYYQKTGNEFRYGLKGIREVREEYLNFFKSIRNFVKKCESPISESLKESIDFRSCRLADSKTKETNFKKSHEYFFRELPELEIYYTMHAPENNDHSLWNYVKGDTNLDLKLMILSANGEIHSMVYQIFSKKVFYLSTAIEPLNVQEKFKMHLIFRPIRSYLYTLIFSGQHGTVVVDEIEFDPTNESKRIIPIRVTPFNKTMSLEDIWNMPQKERITHFLTSVKSLNIYGMIIPPVKYSPDEFIYKDYLIPCCVLRYLIQFSEILSENDIEAFLITFVYVNNSSSKFNTTIYKDARGMHLASLFMKAMEHFILANDVCGKPIDNKNFYIWKFFNGVFFQLTYYHCISNNKEFIKSHLPDEMALLQLLNTVDKLKRFVNYGLEDFIHNSREKYSQLYGKKSYETSNTRSKSQSYAMSPENRPEMPYNRRSIDLEYDREITSKIFENERQQQRYLANKISPIVVPRTIPKATFMGRGKSITRIDEFEMGPAPPENFSYQPFRNNSRKYNKNRYQNLKKTVSLDRSNNSYMSTQYNQDTTADIESVDLNNNKDSDVIDYANMNFLDDFSDTKRKEPIENLTIGERPRLRCGLTEKVLGIRK